MNYNFDELTERRNTGCVKWDSNTDPDILPLWVADMDFRTASRREGGSEATCRLRHLRIRARTRLLL